MIKLIGVLASFLILTLSGCSLLSFGKTPPIKQTQNLPPSVLLEDCEKPFLKTVRKTEEEYSSAYLKHIDLVMLVLEYDQSLNDCNIDKGALRYWRDKQKDE